MFDTNKIMIEGKPFLIEWDIPDNTSAQEIDLDTYTYDSTAGYFKDKMLWISAIKIVPGGESTEFSFVDFDDVLFWHSIAAGERLILDGSVLYDSTPEPVGKSPAIKSRYGVPFLPVRNKLTAQHSANDGVSKIILWGLYTERTG